MTKISKFLEKALTPVAPKFLEEALTPVAKEIGEQLSDVVNLVFTPVIMAKAVRDKHLDEFLRTLNEKVIAVPEENLKEPNLNIVYPALENVVKYAHNEQYLREVYANLIASSMDKEKEYCMHPSYVSIIEELTSYELKLMSVQKYRSAHKDTVETCLHGIRTYSTFMINPNEFDLSTEQITIALNNLSRLDLLDIHYMDFLNKDIDKHKEYIRETYELLKKNNDSMESYYLQIMEFLELGISDYELFQGKITFFGKLFMDACIRRDV